MYNIHNLKCSFKNLGNLITRARKRRNLTELESGLLDVAASAVARAERGADTETLRCLMAMAEKIESILSRKPAEVIDLTGHFHKSVTTLAPKFSRRRNSQIGIERRAA